MAASALRLAIPLVLLDFGGAAAATPSRASHAPARFSSPCHGEFELDPDTDECVLAANFGAPDEPMALSTGKKGCGVGAFACPGGECVASAAEYAACATGHPARHFHPPAGFASSSSSERSAASVTGVARAAPHLVHAAAAAVAAAAATTRCNLTGLWHCDGVDGRVATDAALGEANVTAVDPPPGWLWQTGEGVLGSDGATLFMQYVKKKLLSRSSTTCVVLTCTERRPSCLHCAD